MFIEKFSSNKFENDLISNFNQIYQLDQNSFKKGIQNVLNYLIKAADLLDHNNNRDNVTQKVNELIEKLASIIIASENVELISPEVIEDNLESHGWIFEQSNKSPNDEEISITFL